MIQILEPRNRSDHPHAVQGVDLRRREVNQAWSTYPPRPPLSKQLVHEQLAAAAGYGQPDILACVHQYVMNPVITAWSISLPRPLLMLHCILINKTKFICNCIISTSVLKNDLKSIVVLSLILCIYSEILHLSRIETKDDLIFNQMFLLLVSLHPVYVFSLNSLCSMI